MRDHRLYATKIHGNGHGFFSFFARERNREAGDGGERIGVFVLPKHFVVAEHKVVEGNALEGEVRLAVVPSHYADLVAAGGRRADGVIPV